MCDRCGGMISWEVDSNLKHGHICTKCIDRDFGKYRILTLDKYDLKIYGVDPSSVSDDELDNCGEFVTDRVMSGSYYFDAIQEYVSTHSIGNVKNG